ncbi:C1 family peptidase [Bdellovibrionota bacterium FG-1]
MAKINQITSVMVLSLAVAFSSQGALAAHSAESSLDSLIPKTLQNKIDQRKDQRSRALAFEPLLQNFNGSKEVDLRNRDTPVKAQFAAKKCVGVIHSKVGTCSAFGLAAAVENVLGGGIELSERQLWSQYCVASSAVAIDTITSGKGVVEDSYWPENSVNPTSNYSKATRYKVLESHALEDNIVAMLEALDRGSPLYFAINTPSEMYAKKPVINADSGNTGGGHAIAIVGYRLDDTVEGGGYLLVKNSWGTSDQFDGYQLLAFGYCAKKGNYCAAWSIDRVGTN